MKNNLKLVIRKSGITQRELAKKIGVTEVSISRYISNERVPNGPTLAKIIDVLGCDFKDIYPSEEVEELKEETNAEEEISDSDKYLGKLFDLFLDIDRISISKDLAQLRNIHYENMEWLKQNNFSQEYYDYFFEFL